MEKQRLILVLVILFLISSVMGYQNCGKMEKRNPNQVNQIDTSAQALPDRQDPLNQKDPSRDSLINTEKKEQETEEEKKDPEDKKEESQPSNEKPVVKEEPKEPIKYPLSVLQLSKVIPANMSGIMTPDYSIRTISSMDKWVTFLLFSFTFEQPCTEGEDCIGEVYIFDYVKNTPEVQQAFPEAIAHFYPSPDDDSGRGSSKQVSYKGYTSYQVALPASKSTPKSHSERVIIGDRFVVMAVTSHQDFDAVRALLDKLNIGELTRQLELNGEEPKEQELVNINYQSNDPFRSYQPFSVPYGSCTSPHGTVDEKEYKMCYEYYNISNSSMATLKANCASVEGSTWSIGKCEEEYTSLPSCIYYGEETNFNNMKGYSLFNTKEECENSELNAEFNANTGNEEEVDAFCVSEGDCVELLKVTPTYVDLFLKEICDQADRGECPANYKSLDSCQIKPDFVLEAFKLDVPAKEYSNALGEECEN